MTYIAAFGIFKCFSVFLAPIRSTHEQVERKEITLSNASWLLQTIERRCCLLGLCCLLNSSGCLCCWLYQTTGQNRLGKVSAKNSILEWFQYFNVNIVLFLIFKLSLLIFNVVFFQILAYLSSYQVPSGREDVISFILDLPVCFGFCDTCYRRRSNMQRSKFQVCCEHKSIYYEGCSTVI